MGNNGRTEPERGPWPESEFPVWQLQGPQSESIGDHAVDLRGGALSGRRVAVLVCGGIAAFKAPLLLRALRREGAFVQAFLSEEAERYVTPDALAWAANAPVVQRLGPQAEHLSDGAPFDAYLVAPATYNTINKVAVGIADGVVTATLASAIGRMEAGKATVLVAPTMHGTMHNSILVASLARLKGLGVRVIPPRDAYGKDNLPEEERLVMEVAASLSGSAMRGRRICVVGGSWLAEAPGRARVQTPMQVDVRQLATRLQSLGALVSIALPEGEPGPVGVPRLKARSLASLRADLVQAVGNNGWEALVWGARVAREEDEGLFVGEPAVWHISPNDRMEEVLASLESAFAGDGKLHERYR